MFGEDFCFSCAWVRVCMHVCVYACMCILSLNREVFFTVGHGKNHLKATDIQRRLGLERREREGKDEAREIGEGLSHRSNTIKGEDVQKDTYTPMFTAALFTIAKSWKQPKGPLTDEWIKKIWYIHTMEYYSAIEKNGIMPFAAI